jgi:hypothetical protein
MAKIYMKSKQRNTILLQFNLNNILIQLMYFQNLDWRIQTKAFTKNL